jgi:hypothetical protein
MNTCCITVCIPGVQAYWCTRTHAHACVFFGGGEGGGTWLLLDCIERDLFYSFNSFLCYNVTLKVPFFAANTQSFLHVPAAIPQSSMICYKSFAKVLREFIMCIM